MIAVLFGLTSAAVWGAGDFSGGLASRRSNVFGVVFVSQIFGMLLFIVFALVRAEPPPSMNDVLWGVAAGLVGSVGILAFYRVLAIQHMGLAAPISAIVTAGLPVVFGAFTQGLPQPSQLLGFALALGGVWLLARPSGSAGGSSDTADRTAKPQSGLALALLAGLGFGGFLILIGRTSHGAIFWPLVAARIASITMIGIVAVRSQRDWLPIHPQLPLVIMTGILDACGNMFYVLAVQTGRLDVAAVLSSLYPASTLLLARIVLRERINRGQLAGFMVALVAIPLITITVIRR